MKAAVKQALFLSLLALLTFAAPLLSASAQDAAALAAAAAPGTAPAAAPPQPESGPFRGSLFFSPAEIASVQRALAGKTSGGEAMLHADTPQDIPMRRVISVAGVIYRGDNDWIVWVNGKKVTPKELLPEIVDIRVAREKVELKWFDIGINGVISISLRPHQTYDIVTGVLLPG